MVEKTGKSRTPPEETFLTIPEVARLLRVSERSAYKMAQCGELAGAVKFRGQWRVEREILMRWVREQGTVAPTRRDT